MISTIMSALLDAVGNLLFFIGPFALGMIYVSIKEHKPLSYWFEEDEGEI